MVVMGMSMLLQDASAGAVAPDSAGSMMLGLGTSGEVTMIALVAIAAVGAVIAVLVGDRVRRAEAARRPAEWGDGRR